MSIILTVDIDYETQTVHIGEENGSGCVYPVLSDVSIGEAITDYLSSRKATEELNNKQQCLKPEEYSGLTRMAKATKMDCWFFIRQKDGFDYIYDLESGKYMDFSVGLSQLAEGITDPLSQLGLTAEEIKAVENLFRKNGIIKRGEVYVKTVL